MLRSLTVENVALIQWAELELGRGLTALTGETGAGKSLVLDALQLALGGRADRDLVRAGERKAVVTLVVDVAQAERVAEVARGLGLDPVDDELVIQREVRADGGSSARVNGRPVSVSVLRELGRYLVDLHGQHEHQSLLDPLRQREMLDAWAGEEVLRLRAEVAAKYAECERVRRLRDQLHRNRREREQRRDLLQFQCDEIADVAPVVGEWEELQQELSRLQNAERLGSAVAAAWEDLAGEDASLLGRLQVHTKSLEQAQRWDESLGEVAAQMREALAGWEEITRALAHYRDHLEVSPDRLEEVAARLDALQRLRRKYGDDEAAVIAHAEACSVELMSLLDDADSAETLTVRAAQLESERDALVAELRAKRQWAASRLGPLVESHLHELAMPHARIEVALHAQPVDESGGDSVELMLQANPGETLLPLAKVASGGELSRVMLALKVAGAGQGAVPTLVFDEVDTGLSGAAAAATARKLQALGQHTQVIVISHLPQIAALADDQIRISKRTETGRTFTDLLHVAAGDRVDEIARLMAGETITETARVHARALLAGRGGAGA